MATINFYHAQGETPAAVDALLPPLLEKAIQAGAHILLVTPTAARRQRVDEALWTYADAAFLPHATVDDARPEAQPVLLATAEDDMGAHLNGRLPVLLAGAESALEGALQTSPEKLFYLFSAAPADVERARALWKTLKKQEGHTLTYWQKTDSGWSKKG